MIFFRSNIFIIHLKNVYFAFHLFAFFCSEFFIWKVSFSFGAPTYRFFGKKNFLVILMRSRYVYQFTPFDWLIWCEGECNEMWIWKSHSALGWNVKTTKWRTDFSYAISIPKSERTILMKLANLLQSFDGLASVACTNALIDEQSQYVSLISRTKWKLSGKINVYFVCAIAKFIA